MVEYRESAYRQIRNLLITLTLGVALAVALSLFFLYYYSPSGSYRLKNVLLAPSSVESLSFSAKNRNTREIEGPSFEKMTFLYWQPSERQWRQAPVSLNSYREFYERLGDETSLADITPAMINEFQQQPMAKLIISLKQSEGEKSISRVFQEIHFAAKSDLFRVELREDQAAHSWAYFTHPRIYNEAMAIFLKDTP